MKRLIFFLPIVLLLGAAAPPPGAIRHDEAFWNMLTPAGREVLSGVPVVIVPGPCTWTARFVIERNAIEACGQIDVQILRHEALHALDWDGAEHRSVRPGGFLAVVGKDSPLHAEVSALYPGFLAPQEIWATVPLVVGWDFGALPDDVATFYAPWFSAAQR